MIGKAHLIGSHVVALSWLLLACGDDADATPAVPDGGTAMEDPLADTWGPINYDCPDTTRPLTGMGAKRGACCYRGEPNSLRIDAYGAGPASVTEYRAQYLVQTNHPYSLSLMVPIVAAAVSRVDNEEQSLLFRFTMPRDGSGNLASGPGSITVGQGRYNCDGTYSFFSDTAAPTGGEFPGADDPGRWAPTEIPLTVDGTKTGREAAVIAFEDNPNGRTYTPFVDSNTYQYDWELVTQGLDIVEFDTEASGLDCQGRRGDRVWEPEMRNEAYATIDDNHYMSNGIGLLQGQTFAQLVAFGPLAQAPDRESLDPRLGGTARCIASEEDLNTDMPATRECRWVKLPSALCPETDEERDLFRCHLAWEDNPYGEATNCTMTAPTTPRSDPEGDEGQCCDPLGETSSGLPACNAYRLEIAVVAAAADITDTPGPLTEDCRL